MEEVLVSVRRLDEPETLIADQALDDALLEARMGNDSNGIFNDCAAA